MLVLFKTLAKKKAYVDVVYEEKYKQYVKDPDATKTGRFKTSQVAGITVENIMPITDQKHFFYNNNYLIPEENSQRRKDPPSSLKLEILRIHITPGDYESIDGLLNEFNLGIKETFSEVWLACLPGYITLPPDTSLAPAGDIPSTEDAKKLQRKPLSKKDRGNKDEKYNQKKIICNSFTIKPLIDLNIN